jgi:hypothetical protein
MIPNFKGCFEYNPSKNPLKGLTKEEKEQFAHAYMEMWVASEGFDDLAIMHKSGDVELLAHTLVNAGAIDSKNCFENCKAIEKLIEKMAKTFDKLPRKNQLKRLDEAFKDCIVVRCDRCNHAQFPANCNFEMYKNKLEEKCWECSSKNIKIYPWGKK